MCIFVFSLILHTLCNLLYQGAKSCVYSFCWPHCQVFLLTFVRQISKPISSITKQLFNTLFCLYSQLFYQLFFFFQFPILRRNSFQIFQVCTHYGSQMSCSSNPECGWCPSDGICYLRTLTSKCASNLKTQKCPGICPNLPDCQSCNLFSSSNTDGYKSPKTSISQIIGNKNVCF